MTNALAHHGIQGMRWGVRRYQNPDGTLTAAGRRRLGNDVSYDSNGHVSSNDRDTARNRINDAVSNDYKNVSKGLNSADNAIKSAQSANKKIQKVKKDKAVAEKISEANISKMSDKELRQAVERMNLERSYRTLSAEKVNTGSDYVSDILSVAGDIVAVGTSVASIAMVIHTIRS